MPATKHGTLLHHAVMLQLSDATRALLLAGDFVVSDKKLEIRAANESSAKFLQSQRKDAYAIIMWNRRF